MNKCLLNKVFPEYFKDYNIPPDDAEDARLFAYRACKTDAVDKESFTSTYEELGGIDNLSEEDKKNPSCFSLSVFGKAKDVKRFAVTNSAIRPPHKIAKGYTDPEYGKVKKAVKGSHIDWWLYKDVEPWKSFELIEDFCKYFEDIKKGIITEGG